MADHLAGMAEHILAIQQHNYPAAVEHHPNGAVNDPALSLALDDEAAEYGWEALHDPNARSRSYTRVDSDLVRRNRLDVSR